MGTRGVGARAAGDEIAAEPVPVRRPGVRVTGDEGCIGRRARPSEEHIGSIKIGLNLNANHKISIVEAQLQTIRSPALGFHFSGAFAPLPLFRVTSSTGIHGRPSTSNTSLEIMAVSAYVTALCRSGTVLGRRLRQARRRRALAVRLAACVPLLPTSGLEAQHLAVSRILLEELV